VTSPSMYRMLEYRTKRYLKYQNIDILLFLLRRFSQSLASQYGKPFLLKGNFICIWFKSSHIFRVSYKLRQRIPKVTSLVCKCLLSKAFHSRISMSLHSVLWNSINWKIRYADICFWNQQCRIESWLYRNVNVCISVGGAWNFTTSTVTCFRSQVSGFRFSS